MIFALFCLTGLGQQRSIAFTFDDLPISGRADSIAVAIDVNKQLLEKLKFAGITATGFVNEGKLFFPGEIDRRTAILESWLVDGHDLGNHTFSHIAINSAPFETYKEDLIRGETITRMLLEKRGRKLRYFRHTQLRTGPTDDYRRRLTDFLQSRSYTVAPVTIDSNEYLFAARYREAKAANDVPRMRRIAGAYLEYMQKIVVHFEKLSAGFLGYEVKQILLLHVNELNADCIDALASMLRDRKYEFITLEQALTDKAYSLPEVTSRRGLSWIHRWMLAKGLEMKEEPAEPAWIRVAQDPS
ncbi:MAG: polysaccharide deacetylase family protein [Acidobacteriota bacterium]|nr:polysaccharide deacetylase family protein [Acidobacteriota bacterium]